jgi:hypothetical protein
LASETVAVAYLSPDIRAWNGTGQNGGQQNRTVELLLLVPRPSREEMEVNAAWNSTGEIQFQGQATLHHFSITGIITCKNCSLNLLFLSERHQKSRSFPQDPSCMYNVLSMFI